MMNLTVGWTEGTVLTGNDPLIPDNRLRPHKGTKHSPQPGALVCWFLFFWLWLFYHLVLFLLSRLCSFMSIHINKGSRDKHIRQRSGRCAFINTLIHCFRSITWNWFPMTAQFKGGSSTLYNQQSTFWLVTWVTGKSASSVKPHLTNGGALRLDLAFSISLMPS